MVALYDIADLKQRVASRKWQLSAIEQEDRGRNAHLLEVLEAVERTLVQNQRYIHRLKKEQGLARQEFKRLRDLLPEMRIERPNPLRRIFRPSSVAARRELVERLESITSAMNAESGARSDCDSAELGDPASIQQSAGTAFLVAAIVSLMMVATLLAGNFYDDYINDSPIGSLLHRHFGDVSIKDGDRETVSQQLELAQRQMAHLRLTTPAGDNAYETYRQILSVHPNNEHAMEGIKQIGAGYRELASRAAAKGDLQKSEHYAKLAAKLAPVHAGAATMAVPAEAVPEASRKLNPPAAPSYDSLAHPHDPIRKAEIASTEANMTRAYSPGASRSSNRSGELAAETVQDHDKSQNHDLIDKGFGIQPPIDLTNPRSHFRRPLTSSDFRRSHDHDLPLGQAEGVGGQSLDSNGQAFGHASGPSAGSGSGGGGSAPGDKDTGNGKGAGKGGGQGKGAGKGGNKGSVKGRGNGKSKG